MSCKKIKTCRPQMLMYFIYNFDVIFNEFIRIALQIIDRHTSIEKFSRRQKKLLKKPWITKAILVSIRKKRVLFKTHYVNGNNSQKSYFKQYLNKLTKIETISKKLYFEKELHLNRDNPKRTWDIIKTLLPSKSKSYNNTQDLHDIAFDSVAKQAEQFNEFFCTIGEKLSNKIPTYQANHFKTYLAKRVSESMFLEPANITEIVNIILSLNVNKAVDHDNIPAYFLKIAPFTIAPFLLILINYAFTNGIFPNNCKISKVIPIHKNGETNNPNNFRPISLLTCFSKILEKIIFKRITRFLNKHDVLNPQEYGFQKGISTAHAILNTVSTTFGNINRNQFTAIFFLDLKKAFDTVCHKTLLKKLHHYGLRGSVNKLLELYLLRHEFVSLNNTHSTI